jgi:hypothetical protein
VHPILKRIFDFRRKRREEDEKTGKILYTSLSD